MEIGSLFLKTGRARYVKIIISRLYEARVEETYLRINAWLIGLDIKILNGQGPTTIENVIKRQTSYGAEVYREEAKFVIQAKNEDTKVDIE